MQQTPDEGDQAPNVGASATPETETAVTPAERTTVLWLSNASHAVNHFQNGMLSVLWVPIMEELGFGLQQLGVLQAIRSTLNSVSQGLYGFLTPFFRRTRILAFANMLMGLGVMLSGFAFSFWSFVGSRVFAATGSSAQHPVGASLLSGYFPRNRGTILALNASVASVGSFLAPLVATAMLSYIGWRQIFFVLAGFSVVFGLVYLFFSERRSVDERRPRGTAGKLREGFSNYRLVLKNRNILAISLVMMVGAGGRGGGVNDLYLIPWMRTELLLGPWTAAWAKSVQQLGGIVGPLGFGWLSDRLSRTRVLQASLVLSAFGSWLVAVQDGALVPLFVSLAVYGAFTHSRMTLTQPLVADSVTDEQLDAAFSVFYTIGFISTPFWALLTGALMALFSFQVAFSVLALSYLLGVVLMFWVKDMRKVQGRAADILPGTGFDDE